MKRCQKVVYMKRPSTTHLLLPFDEIENRGWVVGRHFPEQSARHSKNLQLGYNVSREAWQDAEVHGHAGSEEYCVVLKGRLKVQVGGAIVTVGPREILGVKPRVPHAVLGGEGPVEEFTIRAPSLRDKKKRSVSSQ